MKHKNFNANVNEYNTDNFISFLQKNIIRKRRRNQTLSKLSVVIPSYGRQDFIIRQCAYWHGRGASVVIVDGSPKPIVYEIQKIMDGLCDITYLHSTDLLVDRLAHAATLIKTPYSVLCGDDEFLLETGLCSAISLLEREKDLVACIGQSIHYYLTNNGLKCSYGTNYLNNVYKYDIRHDDLQERLYASVKNYNSATCYAVTRSPVWCKSWGNVKQTSSGDIIEFEHALTTYIWGKLASVDDVYWMRSVENPPAETVDVKRLPAEKWWTSNKFKTERENFVTKLGQEITSVHQMDRIKAEALICDVFDFYLQNEKYFINISFRRKYRQLTLNILKNLLPGWLVLLVTRYVRRLRTIRPFKGNFGTLDDLKSVNTPVPFLLSGELVAELSCMENLIADFYKARS